eukprot:5693812-Pleurochrysis_carterae.AAC.2
MSPVSARPKMTRFGPSASTWLQCTANRSPCNLISSELRLPSYDERTAAPAVNCVKGRRMRMMQQMHEVLAGRRTRDRSSAARSSIVSRDEAAAPVSRQWNPAATVPAGSLFATAHACTFSAPAESERAPPPSSDMAAGT